MVYLINQLHSVKTFKFFLYLSKLRLFLLCLGDKDKVLYFDMPQYVKGRQIKSYGGSLDYSILYRGQGMPTSDAPHVVLSVSLI